MSSRIYENRSNHFYIVSIILVGLLFGFGMIQMGYLVVRYKISLTFLTDPLLAIACLTAWSYGSGFAAYCHPVFDSEYRKWLATTPWTPAHPLPRGPLIDLRTDAIVIVALSLLCIPSAYLRQDYLQLLSAPLILVFFGKLMVWFWANVRTAQWNDVYGALAIPLLLLFLPFSVWTVAPIAIATLVVSWNGVNRSLQRFPWSGDYSEAFLTSGETPYSADYQRAASVGWPYAQLLLDPVKDVSPRRRLWIENLIIAGWVGLLLSRLPYGDQQAWGMVALWFVIAGIAMASYRLVACRPAICGQLCWGLRRATGRWIVPRHDHIFLGPMLIMLLAIAAPQVTLRMSGTSPVIILAATAGLMVYLLRNFGLDIREMHYTGPHSITGGSIHSKYFERL